MKRVLKIEMLNNKLILKNAVMLTIRMIVVTFVGLYTARIVFAQLGEESYGIFAVIGGIIAFMGFLTTSISGATSRFITFEVGKGDEIEIRKVFNSSLMIHVSLAVLVVIVGETVGLDLLNNVLKLPLHRMVAANAVYQITVISTAITIMQYPFEALVMAYERMHVYSYLELLSVALKLLIVYLMEISNFDKLITYSFLLLCVSILIAILYRAYCHRHFACCQVLFPLKNEHIKRMLKFSSIDLYGNGVVTAKEQGMMYAVNYFFGTVYNAGTSIAWTINGMLVAITQTGTIVYTPQIIKQYSQGNLEAMQKAMGNSLKFTLTAMAIVSVPIVVEAETFIKLWLGAVPTYGVELFRIITLQSFFPVINNVLNNAIHATGNIKRLTYINGSLFMGVPLTTLLVFYLGGGILWATGMDIIFLIIIIGSAFSIVHRLIPTLDLKGLFRILTVTFIIILVSLLPIVFIHRTLEAGILRLIYEAFTYFTFVGVLSWFFLFSKDERFYIIGKSRDIFSPLPRFLWRALR